MRPHAVLAALAALTIGCASTPKPADYVGDPKEMAASCERASVVCPPDDDWIGCNDDLNECYRLGLWYDDGIKVPRDPAHAHAIYESMCNRFELGSCDKLCERGESTRCVDLALLGISGAGGRPFPPTFRDSDRSVFATACKAGDVVACLMLELAYVPAAQPVVREVNDCRDDHAHCFARACSARDPLGCALLCHTGDARACAELGRLGMQGIGFRGRVASLARRLLEERCRDRRDRLSCAVLDEASEGAEDTLSQEPYDFERAAEASRAVPRAPRAPRAPERPVGEGLWSGWKTVGNVEGGSPGVSGVLTRTVGAHRSTDVSALAGFSTEVFMRSWYPASDKYLHFSLAAAIGGGSAGVDGTIEQESTGGFRFPLASIESGRYSHSTLVESMSPEERDALRRAIFTEEPGALFARAGYAIRYSAIGPVLSSAIELPRLEAGYQLEGDDDGVRAMELRANAGLVLVGRYGVGDAREPLGGGTAWGGALVLHARRAHLALEAQTIRADILGDFRPVYRIDSNPCLRVVQRDERHYAYLLCFRQRMEHGEIGTPAGAVTSWQTGIYFGLDALD